MKTLFTALCLMVALSVQAIEVKLAVITSEFDDDTTDFYVVLDESNKIDSLRKIAKNASGQIYEDLVFPAETVIDEGVVLVERQGRKAVILEVEDFTVENGGIVKLNYLYNGASGTRRAQRFALKKVNGEFQLFDLEGKRVNKMYLWAHRIRILGIVGVSRIEYSYAPGLLEQE